MDEIAKQTWISGDAVTEFIGDGPEVTDDRPLSEYFLIRRFLGDGTGRGEDESTLRDATSPWSTRAAAERGAVASCACGSIGLALGAAVFASYLALWVALTATGGTDGADYTAFYTGWTIVLDGNGANLYDPATQAAVQREILGGRSFEAGLNLFNNPPYLVLPFVPWHSPLQTSYLVWAIIQLCSSHGSMYRLLTRSRRIGPALSGSSLSGRP